MKRVPNIYFEHVHVPIRMVDAPKIDENEDGGS